MSPVVSHTMLHQFSPSLIGALLLSLLVATLYLFFVAHRTPAKRPNQLPAPPKLPLLGNLHQLGSLAHHSLRTLSEKHGPVMLLYFGRFPTVVVSSAKAAQEVMKTQDLTLATRPDSSLADRVFYGCRDIIFNKYGDYWRKLRRICVVHLLSPKRVHSFRWVRAEEVALLVDRIRAASGPVNISEMLIALTCDVICRVAFGRNYAEEEGGGSRVHALFSEISGVFGTFPMRDFVPWLGWIDWLSGLDARVRNTALNFDAFLEKILQEHESKRFSNSNIDDDSSVDLLHILLSLGATDGSDGISLDRDSIKAIILDMFGAGTDTTYVTMEWAMAELIKHPREMKRVQEEIRRVVGSEGTVGEEVLEGMVYLQAVIKETLRLHPPLPLLLPREAMEDTQLLDYHVPKGTRVMINAWAIGRDPVSWEKPEEFWPERFLNNRMDFKGQDFQYIPFGGGRRGCPGIEFAIRTAELALANLLYHFDWELPDGMKGEELDMSEAPGITTDRKSNLILVAKPLTS